MRKKENKEKLEKNKTRVLEKKLEESNVAGIRIRLDNQAIFYIDEMLSIYDIAVCFFFHKISKQSLKHTSYRKLLHVCECSSSWCADLYYAHLGKYITFAS